MSLDKKIVLSDQSEKTYRESIVDLLSEEYNTSDGYIICDLIDSAHLGFSDGVNQFFEKSLGAVDNQELKTYLQTYPLVQIFIGILKYRDINHDVGVVRKLVNSFLDNIED